MTKPGILDQKERDRSVILGQPLSSASLLNMLHLVVTAGEMHSSGRCKCCATCILLSAFLPRPSQTKSALQNGPINARRNLFSPKRPNRSACPTLTGSQ